MRISRWGASLAVRLPRRLVEEMGLVAGDEVELVKAEGGAIAVEKVDRRKAALDRMARRGWTTPDGFRFDRDEANAR